MLTLLLTETAREQLETELHNVKSAATNSTTEVQALESRIKSLEAQNRDAIALHESKSAAHDRLADELSAQHQKIVGLRKQLSELEEKNQTLENAATSAKYREQNLQREIESLKKSNDWYESELEKRSTDNTKFRKEKNAKISELQRLNADASQQIESLRRTETSQRQRLDELGQKVEQSLVRIQQLQDEAAQKQQSFQAELDNTRRLATLHQESANTAKAHLQQVKEQLEAVNDNAAHEVGQLQAEVDSERNQREATEAKVAELELQVEGLESQIIELRNAPQIPATPQRGGLGASFGTPGRAGSPSVFSPGSARTRGGLSTTQLYAENIELKKKLRGLEEKESNLQTVMQEMMAELEDRQPEIDELRQENERLTEESGSISDLLHEATKEKEAARKEARKCQADYQGLIRENEIQRQQLRDLSVELRMHLLNHRFNEEGLEALTHEEQSLVRQWHDANTMPDELISDSTDTGRLISQRMILFRNVNELELRNQELVRALREVADRYEGSEAKQKTDEIEQDRKELAKLREQVLQHQDEIKSLELRSQSLMKERDMFRRIVTSRGQVLPGADMEAMFGQSVNGGGLSTPARNMSQDVEQTPRTQEIAGYEKLVKDLQAHLDALRREFATDMATLRQQNDQLAKEKSQMQGDKMRLENAVQLANERFELQGNKVSLLQSENNELKKRCDTLQDLAAKQDIKTQQVAEDLLEAKSQADSLLRENANLKASRDLAKSTELRLQQENATLIEDRSGLNKMIANLQNLRNEQELTEAENRRRLQSRTESLESELQACKRKLEDQVEEHKKATLLLESEQLKSRSAIDDLRKVLNNIRPELAAVKTERDHLQARVDELKAELRIAEERGQDLRQRPAPHATATAGSSEEDISREEHLSIEISNLKRELETAQEEVEASRTDATKYQAIARDVEEQMEGHFEAHEQYQQEMDELIAEKDNHIRDLEKRVEEISSELAATNTELTELRRTHDEEGALFAQRKAELDSEITRLQEEADRYKQTAAFHQEDLKAQAEIATRAQQNYENELVKHSDAMKNLQNEREQHNALKTEVARFKAQAEGARAALEEGKEHWAESRERYERELNQSRTKLNELEEQNKIVHQQLENVSTQIASLKQSRVSVAGRDSDTLNADQASGLQEVVNYLRKEKEILEVQYELALNENKKLEATVKGLQSQLDQTRDMLSAAQQSQAQPQHGNLSLEAYERNVEQMNTLRESNITLRNDLRQATTRLEDKNKEVETLYAQIQPLQARVQELEVELEATVKELESARQNGEHWQKRYQEVLHKYDRIDPAELEALKDKMSSLEAERDQAKEAINGFEERLATEKKTTQDQMEATFAERRERMITQFKERSKQLSGQLKDKDRKLEEVTQERDAIRNELMHLQSERISTKAALDETIANAKLAMHEEGQIQEGLWSEERRALEERERAAGERAHQESIRASLLQNQVEETTKRVHELENTVVSGLPAKLMLSCANALQGELQQRIASLNQELTDTQKERDQLSGRIHGLEGQSTATDTSSGVSLDHSTVYCIMSNVFQDELQRRLSQATARINELEAQLSEAMPSSEGEGSDTVTALRNELQRLQGEVDRQKEELERYKEELMAKEKESEDLRTHVEMESTINVGDSGTAASVSEQVAQQVAVIKQDLETREQALKAAEERADQRVNSMKRKFNEKLTLKIDEQKKKEEEHEEALNKLRSEHEEAVSKLKSEHELELVQVRQAAETNAGSSAPAPTPDISPFLADVEVPELTKPQLQTLISRNPHAKEIVTRNIRTKVLAVEEKHAKELEELKATHAKELAELTEQHAKNVKELEDKVETQATELEELKAQQAKEVNDSKEKQKEQTSKLFEAKLKMYESRATQAKITIEAFEKAAKETPEKHVAEVWEEAKPKKKQPQASPAANSSPVPSTTSSITAAPPSIPGLQGQTAANPLNAFSTPNGGSTNPFVPPALGQSSFGQPSQFAQPGTFGRPSGQPFQNMGLQGQQNFGASMPQGRPGMMNQGQTHTPFGGFGGLPQPGFAGTQSTAQLGAGNTSRPNSPFMGQSQQQPQQQPQQGGRGRGQNNVGTGPAALRDLASQQGQSGPQSNIPRPGGLPRPTGRGQGNQQQQNQAAGSNAAGSQIGRGGGRGNRGGRGSGQQIQTNQGPQVQGQNSPRSLNPNAGTFQPGGGRGQKRSHEDGGDGEGSHRGGKRARGGAGGSHS